MTDTQEHDLTARAIARWREELTGIGGPNTLLWFDSSGRGSLELTTAHPAGFARLFSSGSAHLSQVVRESYAYAEASRRLRGIHAKVEELQQDRGIDSCWMGIGLATWTLRGDGQRPHAPVFLRRVRLGRVPGHPDDLFIEIVGDATLNPVLASYLRQAHGIELDVDAVTALARAGAPSDPRQAFDEVRRACVDVPGFEIARRQFISTFNLSKSDLVADLMDEHADGHPVLDALAGAPDAATAVGALPPERQNTAPARGVLPSDSSQEAVIDAVLAGAHLTVDGAPGTGKTQTVANLAAALAAQGRPLLFVSHKRAAIDAVQHRLEEAGLGDLVAHMSDGRPGPEFEELFNRRIQEAIAAPTDTAAPQENPSPSATALQAHHEAVHQLHQPWGVSLAQVIEQIAALGQQRPVPRSHARIDSADLLALSPTQRDEAAGRLLDVARKGGWTTTGENDPWYGASIVGEQQAERARATVSELAADRLAAHRSLIDEMFDSVGLPSPVDMREEEDGLELLQQVTGTLEVFRPEVFEAPLGELAGATGGRDYRRENDVHLGLLDRRRLTSQAQDLLRPGPRPDLHGVLVRAHRQRTQWRRIAGKGSRPSAPKGLAEALTEHERLRSELEWLGDRLAGTAAGGDLLDKSFDSLQARLTRLARATDRLEVIPTVADDVEALRAKGLGDLVDDLATRQVPTEQVVPELEFVWWTSVFEHLCQQSDDGAPGATSTGDSVRELLAQYADDEQHRRDARVQAVRTAVDARLQSVVRNLPDQVRAVQQGLARGASLRDLLPVAPELMMALMPCWAMSPLLVPSHVPAGVWFDVVVVDEASQVGTAEVVPAVRRAAQTVLFGDRRQTGPHPFVVDVGRAVDTSRRPASIVDELGPLVPRQQLSTHYRSSDGRLFDFANAQAYGGAIRTFPRPGEERPFRLDVVSGQGGVTHEIDRVVDLVAAHAADPARGSLMVVTLTDEHAERVSTALARRASTDPALTRYLQSDDPEPLLVRSARRAQGFTRDVAVVTVAARVDEKGELVGAAAAALADRGEQALLVALTRARLRTVVVSSLRAGDIAVSSLRTRGAHMFRDLLVHAGTGTLGRPGGEDDSSVQPEQQPGRPGREARRRRTASTGSVLDRPAPVQPTSAQHPLVAELARRLRDSGVTVRSGAGLGQPGLDLVLGDPDGPDQLVALDTDGSTLAAEAEVRDRDLVRPQQLRERGWRYERVCLDEMFRDPARQVARLADLVGDGDDV